MAASRWTARLRLRSRLRWRSSAGITQSAMVGGLVVVSLALTAGLVTYGPEVGSAVGNRFICAFGSGDCNSPDAAAAPTRPPARILTQLPRLTLTGSYDPAGVTNPSPVTGGGSGYTYGGQPLTFDRCWSRANETQNLTNAITQLCTAPDGAVWDCSSTQVTFVIPWPRSRNRCTPAAEPRLPDLVTCSSDQGGGQHCVTVTLDSTTTSGGHTDRVYEDPALTATPAYAADQQACRSNRNKCNTDVTRGLTDLTAQLARLHDQYAECDSSLTNTQTELRTIAGPDGQAEVLVHSDSGWVDPNDPTLSPAEKAAVVYLLTGTVQAQLRAGQRRGRPVEQLPGMLATIRAVNRALPNLTPPAGLSCQDISAALGHINDGRPGPGDVTGVAEYCGQVADGGACSAYGSEPLEKSEPGDSTTELGYAGDSVQVSTGAEQQASLAGIIPGRDDASFDEVVAYCTDHAAECQKKNQSDVEALRNSIYGNLQKLGLCTSAESCQTFIEQSSNAAGACPGGASGWVQISRRAAIVSSIGLTVCGIVLGAVTSFSMGGKTGAAVGSLVTAGLVAVGTVVGLLGIRAAAPAADPRQITALQVSVVALQQAQANTAALIANYPALVQQVHDIEAQLPVQQRQGYFGRILNRLWGGHQD